MLLRIQTVRHCESTNSLRVAVINPNTRPNRRGTAWQLSQNSSCSDKYVCSTNVARQDARAALTLSACLPEIPDACSAPDCSALMRRKDSTTALYGITLQLSLAGKSQDLFAFWIPLFRWADCCADILLAQRSYIRDPGAAHQSHSQEANLSTQDCQYQTSIFANREVNRCRTYISD